MPSSLSSLSPTNLHSLLESCRPFLRGEFESIDKDLPSLIAVLRSVGAGECWHKHGSFLDHLIDIYKILKIWKAPNSVCLCGLFHSAYSNSYVNLAIFDPSTGRETVRRHVGEAAERLIHLFCIVPRQSLIHDDLLFRYADSELVEHLEFSMASLSNAKEKGLFNENEAWRKKLGSILPVDGVIVKHIKTGEDVLVSRRLVAVFLLMTMADFSDQLFNFQDLLFENSNGRLEFTGNNSQTTLWPGDGKPGLWMNSASRMGAIYTLILREEEIIIEQRRRNGERVVVSGRDEEIELVIPPVFDNCTRVLDAEEQKMARELYWEGVCEGSKRGLDWAKEKLVMSIDKNPFVGEPHVVLGQIYLSKGEFEEAEKEAEKGLRLILEWGSPWDKRMSWEGWVAWTRVLLMKAKEKTWPHGALQFTIRIFSKNGLERQVKSTNMVENQQASIDGGSKRKRPEKFPEKTCANGENETEHETRRKRAALVTEEDLLTPNIPQFVKCLKGYNVKKSCFLYVPRWFSEQLSTSDNKRAAVLRNSEGKGWKVNCITQNGYHAFCGGWKQFVSDNNLKEGQVCVFQLVNANELKVSVFNDPSESLLKLAAQR